MRETTKKKNDLIYELYKQKFSEGLRDEVIYPEIAIEVMLEPITVKAKILERKRQLKKQKKQFQNV